MTRNRSTEMHCEAGEHRFAMRKLETLDDIPREIADRRLHGEFGEHIPPERSEVLQQHPDSIEPTEAFEATAHQAGIERTENVLGWSTDLESPAHVRKGDVGREIATLIHEDLHRVTHPISRAELSSTESRQNLYEGITELYTQRATESLHGQGLGECYEDNMRHATALEQMVGDVELRRYYFEHELPETIGRAIERIERVQRNERPKK